MSTLFILSSTIITPSKSHLLHWKQYKEKNEQREREKKYKTTLSSLKQEHLLIVEVSVSVQPRTLNTTLLVLMMHRSDGKEKRE